VANQAQSGAATNADLLARFPYVYGRNTVDGNDLR